MSGDFMNKSIAMADGRMGTIIKERDDEARWGVQVVGEEEIRWISTGEIKDLGGGALIQIPKSTANSTIH